MALKPIWLSVSTAANNEKRSAIMPINDSNNLEMLAEALRLLVRKNRDPSQHLNTRSLQALTTASKRKNENSSIFAKKIPFENQPDRIQPHFPCRLSAHRVRLDAFAAALEKQKLIVHVRRSRGKDIDAACGQLANQLS